MADIKDQLIKDSYNYVLQSDLSTGVVYRIGGSIPINPIFSSGLTINSGFTFSNGTEQDGYVLISDSSGNANWFPSSGLTVSGLTYYVQSTVPPGTGYTNGDRWFDTTTGDETVWINDGVGFGQWVQPNNGGGGGGSGLMGSGTTNYLTIWSSQNTLSSSTIYFDGTNYVIPNLSAGTITSQNYQGNLVTDIQEGFGIDVDQSIGSVTITNTKPDVDVVLNQGDGINIISTYPSFNISNTDRGSSQSIFKNITIDTNTQFSANDNNDTLNFSGIGISITSNVASKTLIFSAGTSSQSVSGDYLPLSGGTVTGETIFQSGLTANTISATTYYNLPVSGLTEGSGISVTGSSGNFTITYTGASSSLQYFVSGGTPTTSQSGDRWFNTNTGVELVWVNDGDSQQWVQPFSVPGPLSPDVGYYLTTGITTSQTITWDKTYWGISGSTNVNLTLPSTTSKEGYYLIIKDEAGICGNYRIRLTPTSGTIDGNNYVDMNINFMSLTCLVRGGNWYLI